MTSATPKPRAGEVCDVCGGRKSACGVLGHRQPGDKTEWQQKPRAGEHTLGPWRVNPSRPAEVQQASGIFTIGLMGMDGAANAQRIVACVNVLEEITDGGIDELQKVGGVKELMNRAHACAAERDLLRERETELVEALEMAAHFLEPRGAIASLAPGSDASHLHRKLHALLAKHGR